MLMPSRLAPAAPAKADWGTAWATNDEPRMTTKKPTTPATTATRVAASQALTMRPGEHHGLGRAARAGGPGRSWRARSRLAQIGQQVDGEEQRDDEEADRPALLGGRPVEAVIGSRMPSQVATTPMARRGPWPCRDAGSGARPRPPGRSAAPCSRWSPTTTDDSDTETPMAAGRQPDRAYRHPLGGGQVAADRAQAGADGKGGDDRQAATASTPWPARSTRGPRRASRTGS